MGMTATPDSILNGGNLGLRSVGKLITQLAVATHLVSIKPVYREGSSKQT